MYIEMLTAFFLLFGLFIGSFLFVLATRLPKGESPFLNRSYCEYCKHTLGVLDLVPLFSFLFLRGKCRYCKKRLSIEYPLSELLTGILFAGTFYFVSTSNFSQTTGIMFPVVYLFYFFVVAGLLIIFFADVKYYIIPFQILLPSLAIVAIWHLYFQPEFFLSYLLSGVAAFVFFLVIFLATKGRGMGFGDVVLAFYMGVLLGFPGIVVALYVAFLTGAFISLILVVSGRKKLKGGVIPFGPFLIFGTFVGIFWGKQLSYIILSYLGL